VSGASACFFALLVAVAYNIREGGDGIWLCRSIWTGIVVTATVGLVFIGSTVGRRDTGRPWAHLPVRSRVSRVVADGAKPRHLIIWLGIAVVTAMVAATRIYLGVHWFSDTLGGVFLGCSAVFAGAALLPDRTGPRASPR
jgi:membrane-associated phospholipid phosphatase